MYINYYMTIHIFDLDDTLLMSDTYNDYLDIKPLKSLNKILYNLNKKYIFTNATYNHAIKCLSNMNAPIFEFIFARDNLYSNQKLKPNINPYIYINSIIIKNNDTELVIFYDDQLSNLETAKQLNWMTVWITKSNDNKPDYVNYKFNNIIDAINYMENK